MGLAECGYVSAAIRTRSESGKAHIHLVTYAVLIMNLYSRTTCSTQTSLVPKLAKTTPIIIFVSPTPDDICGVVCSGYALIHAAQSIRKQHMSNGYIIYDLSKVYGACDYPGGGYCEPSRLQFSVGVMSRLEAG